MWTLMYGLVRTQVLHVAASLRLADLLAEQAMGVQVLAEATHCHADSLMRVLRCLVAMGVLSKDDEERFLLTDLGQMLRNDASLSGRAGSVFYGSRFIWDAWGSLLDNVRTGQTAFEIAHGRPVFEYLSGHPDDFRVNTDFMAEMAGRRLQAASSGFVFPESGIVVDVGGGNGTMLIEVLQAHAGLRGLVFELPEVAGEAEGQIKAAGLSDRCAVQAGSFLDEVPPGGDVYMLSNILHDWDDDHCLRILENCRRSMKNGARLFVIDAVLPNGDLPFTLAALDLQMMVVLGGKQRTASEYRKILEPSGFSIVKLEMSGSIEAVAV